MLDLRGLRSSIENRSTKSGQSQIVGCDSNLEVQTSNVESANPLPQKDAHHKAIKLQMAETGQDCIDPDLNVVSSLVNLTLCNGEIAQGRLDLTNLKAENIKKGVFLAGVRGTLLSEVHSDCLEDGDIGCVVMGPTFAAAAVIGVTSTSIRSGVSIAGITGSLADCTTNGASGCVTNPTYQSADLTNLSPANIKDAISIAGVTGTLAFSGPADCVADGEVGCVTTASYKAAKLSNFIAGDVKSGITIAGVGGALGDCVDGGSGCVVVGPTFKAVISSDLAQANIKFGATIGGVTGNYGPACSSDGGSSCLVDGTNYVAANKTNAVAGNIKSGVSLAGVTGNYPSATSPLSGADGTVDLTSGDFETQVASASSFEWFDSSGVRYTRSGDTNLVASHIVSGIHILGVTGAREPAVISAENMSAMRAPTGMYISWKRTNGTGVLVVRATNNYVSWAPANGSSYNVGTNGIIYKGSASEYIDTAAVNGTWYSYKVYAYNAQNEYAASSATFSPFKTWAGAVCGGSGDSCYSNATAIANASALTPTGKELTYIDTGSGFHVWKDVASAKILRANGLDEWAMELNYNGRGMSDRTFTAYNKIVGRTCPVNVYVDDSNRVATGQCLYYTEEPSAQTLSEVGQSQSDPYQIGLGVWSGVLYGPNGVNNQRWFQGNIGTCSSKGMRLPTVFETTTTITSHDRYPNLDTPAPTFAGASDGVPSHPGGRTHSASAEIYTWYGAIDYWSWSGATVYQDTRFGDWTYGAGTSANVRCVLP